MANKIRAVAIGNNDDWTSESTADAIPTYVRPYVNGLITWLALAAGQKSHPQNNRANKFDRGTGATDYKIEYKERDADDLADAFQGVTNDYVLFCMSTSVGDAAVEYMEANNVTAKMVVISSHEDNFDPPIEVVSATRPQLIKRCLQRFRLKFPNRTYYALHRVGNFASEDALRKIRARVTVVPVLDTDDPATIVEDLQPDGTMGLLVLPADRFFAVASEIVTAAGQMATYWTTPDWPPPNALSGAHGYRQAICGQYMAERVACFWQGLNQPNQKKIPPGEITEV
jgi:hypothetical protein